MAKRIKSKTKKVNFLKVLIFIFILYIVSYGGYFIADQPIQNIRVFDNYLLDDQFILEQAKIDSYPSFLFTTNQGITNRLLKCDLIKEVIVKKRWGFKLDLYIREYKFLFYDQSNDRLVLENKKEIKPTLKNISLPILINYVPDTIYDDFIAKMSMVKDDIIIRISEIQYKPNDVDKERFLLTMIDGNYVYLTLYHFEKINNYNDIILKLEGKKGILYLDAGNYFEILE